MIIIRSMSYSSEDHLLAMTGRTGLGQAGSIADHRRVYRSSQCPVHLFKGLAEIGAFGPSLPIEYGGQGMDEIAYGVIMQETREVTVVYDRWHQYRIPRHVSYL